MAAIVNNNAAVSSSILTGLKGLADSTSIVQVYGEEFEIWQLAQRAGQILETAPSAFSEWAREAELFFDRAEKQTREKKTYLPGGNIGMGVVLAGRGVTREATEAWPMVQKVQRLLQQYCYNGWMDNGVEEAKKNK
jgi:hypothetical protein